jgi:hypothetical protein
MSVAEILTMVGSPAPAPGFTIATQPTSIATRRSPSARWCSTSRGAGSAGRTAERAAMRDNRVESNGRFGIDVFARGSVAVTGNRVLHMAA